MTACSHDGPEAFDGMVAADGIKSRISRRRGIHIFARDPKVCAGLRCKLYQDGVRYEARFLPEVSYGDSTRGGQTD